MYKRNISLKVREKILDELKIILKKTLGKNLVSAIVYGSTLCDDFSDRSDFDVLLVLKDSSFEILNSLREIRTPFACRGILIDLNVHCVTELPKIRKDMFWHNNRSIYIQIELQKYGRVLIGRNLFSNFVYDRNELMAEAVRVVNSLLYQTRKMIINKDMLGIEKRQLMKFCIYGCLYALSIHGVFPSSRKDAMMLFSKKFPFSPPIDFFSKKTHNVSSINIVDVNKAYDFLSKLDRILFERYKILSLNEFKDVKNN